MDKRKTLSLGDRCVLLPLDWKYDKRRTDYGDNDWMEEETWTAETVFSSLRVRRRIEREPADDEPRDSGWKFEYCVDEYYDEGCEPFESEQAGKERAEQWYLSRITPALTTDKEPAHDA
jgi:hypothetical protein